MRILITYDSHNEQVVHTAKMVSELLRRENNEVELVDLIQKEIDILAPFDKVVVGGLLWFGNLSPAVKNYLLKNQTELLIKPVYIFIHAYVGDNNFQAQMAKELPLDILSHANTFNLGMDVDMDSLNPLEKVKWRLTGQHAESPADEAQIRELVSFILK